VWFPERVSDGVARVPVLPRSVAAGVSVFAVTRSAHAIAAMVLLVCIPGVIVISVRFGYTDHLPLSLASVAVMLVVLAIAALRTSTLTLAAFLAVGSLANYLFVFTILSQHPELLPTALVLINRPASILVLVGTAGRRPLPAVAWGIGGFLLGIAGTGFAELQLGLPLQFGNGPAITLANYCALFLGLSIVQRAQSRRVPDFLKLRGETRRLEAVRNTEQRTVALLHDTVLNDLALVINGPDQLDARTVARMRSDVATLAGADLVKSAAARVRVVSSDSSLRNQMTQMVSDFQWRGLSVEFTGDTGSVARMTDDAVSAAVGALGACLENVLAHSGASTAEIVVSSTDEFVTWTVNDAGRGFDPAAVPADRLGLRASVRQRVESAGGTVKVWSAPGNGTSVLFTLPLLPTPLDTGGIATDTGVTA
jgi:signal transduction histidine kinase